MQKQFDYSYSEQELREWMKKIADITTKNSECRRGIVVFNNHVAGQAVNNGHTMIRLLERQAD